MLFVILKDMQPYLMLLNSQGPSVSRCTEALASLVMAGSAIKALALQQAVFAIEFGVTGLLTAPALVAISADTRSCDWVTFGTVAALTAVTAVWTPKVTLAACKEKGLDESLNII